ncbi:hypothetical protein J6590_054842 [Homalodisca vitripennis]|nr:hypothetical protein J6590_054842 [Homalodisca vitripennis]
MEVQSSKKKHNCINARPLLRKARLIQFSVILVQRMESDAVTDLTQTSAIWSHVRLKRSIK